MTPAPTTKAPVAEQGTVEKIGEFTFTLPIRTEGVNQADANDEDTRVRFMFSPRLACAILR